MLSKIQRIPKINATNGYNLFTSATTASINAAIMYSITNIKVLTNVYGMLLLKGNTGILAAA